MTPVIRNAKESPIEEIMNWRMEVLDHVFGFKEDEDLSELCAENRKYYERSLYNQSHHAVFAQVKRETAGCGGVCFFEDSDGRKHAYLMNIYVREAYRHQHLGEAIVNSLIETAIKMGAEIITLETSDAGRGLYKHLGFRPQENLVKLQADKLKEASSTDDNTDGPFCFYEEMPSPDNPDGSCAYLEAADEKSIQEWLPVFLAKARRRGSNKVYAIKTPENALLLEKVGFSYMPDMMILDQDYWRKNYENETFKD